MRKIFCDHCGQEITKKDDYVDMEIHFQDNYYDCDLCAYCKDLIEREIDGRLKEFIGA